MEHFGTQKISSPNPAVPCQGKYMLAVRTSPMLAVFQQQIARNSRQFSSLGHSPMSTPSTTNNMNPNPITPVNPGAVGPSWGIDANTEGGGIWQNTSAKREKIGELKGEMPDGTLSKGMSLDDLATSEERMELDWVDGTKLVVDFVDNCSVFGASSRCPDNPTLVKYSQFLSDSERKVKGNSGLNEITYKRFLANAMTSLKSGVGTPDCLASLKDFAGVEFEEEEGEAMATATAKAEAKVSTSNKTKAQDENTNDELHPTTNQSQITAFQNSIGAYKLALAQAAVEFFEDKYTALSTFSDTDIDRAAVKGTTLDSSKLTVNHTNLINLFNAFAFENCEARTRSLWKLIDIDGDGMLEQEEMNRVADYSAAITEIALTRFVAQAIAELPEIDVNKKRKKKLSKHFSKMIKRHYEIEVEAPHRLRCVYAWSIKKHQDGFLDNVHVNNDVTGFKRYVELQPKISHDEWLVVQKEMFEFMDNTGGSYLDSYREDLQIAQGLGRQNRELYRQCAAFFLAVSTCDFLINWI